MPDLAFLLLEDASPVDVERVVARGKELGVFLTPAGDDDDDDDITVFDLDDGGTVMVSLIAAPHPDAPHMPVGPISATREAFEAAPAHAIVAALELGGTQQDIDARMAAITTAVMAGCKPVGAMLGFGVMFHRPEIFADLTAAAIADGTMPFELCVDITAAQESDRHMSFLTHNMPRYGREDFYVVAPIQGKSALDFLMGMMHWMLVDPTKQLPTGDTVGRNAEEQIEVQRVPNPAKNGQTVIMLELP